jgi:phage terminase large subunit-like protein
MAISVERLRRLGCGLLRRVRRRKPYPGVVRRRLEHDGCPSYINSSESPTLLQPFTRAWIELVPGDIPKPAARPAAQAVRGKLPASGTPTVSQKMTLFQSLTSF